MKNNKTPINQRLYSYVLRSDSGSAPNPYGKVCTLTICKPKIRKNAQPEDWVIGTGSTNTKQADKSKKNYSQYLVYAMRVSQKMTLEEYEEFCRKKLRIKIPVWESTDFEKMVGDCIYYNFSHERLPEILPSVHNKKNRKKDISGINALLSNHFYYFGDNPQRIPKRLRIIIKKMQGHLKITDQKFISKFENWISKFTVNKLYGEPQEKFEFMKPHRNDFSILCSKRDKRLYKKDNKEKGNYSVWCFLRLLTNGVLIST